MNDLNSRVGEKRKEKEMYTHVTSGLSSFYSVSHRKTMLEDELVIHNGKQNGLLLYESMHKGVDTLVCSFMGHCAVILSKCVSE